MEKTNPGSNHPKSHRIVISGELLVYCTLEHAEQLINHIREALKNYPDRKILDESDRINAKSICRRAREAIEFEVYPSGETKREQNTFMLKMWEAT